MIYSYVVNVPFAAFFGNENRDPITTLWNTDQCLKCILAEYRPHFQQREFTTCSKEKRKLPLTADAPFMKFAML